jgi:hypothetical protein
MRKLVLLSGLLPCLLLLAGCPKKGDSADAAAESAAPDPDAAAAANTPPVPDAKNKADVARFQAETAVADDEAKPATFVNARTSPKSGGVVASLKPGTDVHKHAEYQDCFLVTFADPKDANTTLMGWIEKSSFTYVAPRDAGAKDAAASDAAVADAGAVVDAGAAVVDAGAPKCAANEALVTLSASKTACKKKCTADKDCKTAPCENATSAGKVVRVCTKD